MGIKCISGGNYMKSDLISVVLGFLSAVYGLFLHDGFFIFLICVGIILIINGAFGIKGYFNKTYYLSVFIVTLLSLALSCVLLFMHSINRFYSYFDIVAFLVLITLFIVLYQRRHENPKMPWKDGW